MNSALERSESMFFESTLLFRREYDLVENPDLKKYMDVLENVLHTPQEKYTLNEVANLNFPDITTESGYRVVLNKRTTLSQLRFLREKKSIFSTTVSHGRKNALFMSKEDVRAFATLVWGKNYRFYMKKYHWDDIVTWAHKDLGQDPMKERIMYPDSRRVFPPEYYINENTILGIKDSDETEDLEGDNIEKSNKPNEADRPDIGVGISDILRKANRELSPEQIRLIYFRSNLSENDLAIAAKFNAEKLKAGIDGIKDMFGSALDQPSLPYGIKKIAIMTMEIKLATYNNPVSVLDLSINKRLARDVNYLIGNLEKYSDFETVADLLRVMDVKATELASTSI